MIYWSIKIAKNEFTLLWPTVMELFSNPAPIRADVKAMILDLSCLDFDEETWLRAAKNRSLLRQKKLKASFADALIAQSCVDAGIPLLTRDVDFRHFEKHCGLKLVKFSKH